MNSIIYKTIDFKDLSQNEEEEFITIIGNPSTPDIDRTSDKMSPMAFAKSIKTYMKATGAIFYNHDWDNPIGKIVDYKEPSENLPIEITARVYKSADENVYKKLQLGLIKSFSVAFYSKDVKYERAEGKEITNIKDAELLDVSIVTVPANPNANFTILKSLAKGIDKENLLSILNDKNKDAADSNNEQNNKKECEQASVTEDVINVKKSDMDCLLKAVEGLISDFERLIEKSSEQKASEIKQILEKYRFIKE